MFCFFKSLQQYIVFLPVYIFLQKMWIRFKIYLFKGTYCILNIIKFSLIEDIGNYKIIIIFKKIIIIKKGSKRPTDGTYNISSLLENIICTLCYMMYMHFTIFVRIFKYKVSQIKGKNMKYEIWKNLDEGNMPRFFQHRKFYRNRNFGGFWWIFKTLSPHVVHTKNFVWPSQLF